MVHRLEVHAQRMRARLDDLQDVDAPARGGVDRSERVSHALRAERETLQKQLADAVAALETIRLGLLRLRSGAVSVQSLTTDLAAPGEVGEGVDQLLEGQREVDAELKQPALPLAPPSPVRESGPARLAPPQP